jgi:iron complex transport system substrate-binding protein
MVTAGKGTLGDDLVRFAGGASISASEPAGYPLYSIETVLSKAPEIIIVSSMEGKKDSSNVMGKWRQFKSIPAVKRGAIHVIDSNLVDRPTPRIMEGLEALVRIIHPELLERKR